MPTNVTISHIDTCLPCFLIDHHNRDGETLYGCPVDRSTTYATIRDALLFDLPMADDISDVVTDDMLKAAIIDCFAGVSDLTKPFDASLDAPSDDDDDDDDAAEQCQVWFLITWESDEG